MNKDHFKKDETVVVKPNAQFYLTEPIFNVDLNQDGTAMESLDPRLTGEQAISLTVQNNNYTINYWDLIQGFTDPEGDFVLEISTIKRAFLQSDNQIYILILVSQIKISYNVIDENGVFEVPYSFNIRTYFHSVHRIKKQWNHCFDEKHYGYARDAHKF